jgi:hypothetical protein
MQLVWHHHTPMKTKEPYLKKSLKGRSLRKDGVRRSVRPKLN